MRKTAIIIVALSLFAHTVHADVFDTLAQKYSSKYAGDNYLTLYEFDGHNCNLSVVGNYIHLENGTESGICGLAYTLDQQKLSLIIKMRIK